MLLAFNGTRENGNFMGDQLCYVKVAYLMVQSQPDVDRIIMTMSPGNEMDFLWTKFVRDHRVEVIYDTWNPGDWQVRFENWDLWREQRRLLTPSESVPFDYYRELYLRIHGSVRQNVLCGHERGLNRRNIFEYVLAGQENESRDSWTGADTYDVEIDHPPLTKERDVYISPHCKTQGNITFTFDFWDRVVRRLVDNNVTVTVGYDGKFCEDLLGHPNYRKHWGDHRAWMEQVCRHKLVACGNTGTGWLAAACGVPMITMEPHNSCMADHRYRECGLRNLVEVVDGYKLDDMDNDMARVVDYVARRITEEVKRCVVMTTGCYDVIHAGHIRHLQKCRSLGSKLIVAMNSDESVRSLKGESRPINPQNQRKAVLEALRSVDEVRVTDDPLTVVREVRPDVLAVGYGYTVDKIVGREFVESYGGRAVVTCHGDAKDEPSTTKIVRRVQATTIAEACRAAAPYTVNPYEKLRLMAEQLLSVVHLSGDVVDLGTCRGGTALVMRRLAPDKHLHLFDTWRGTPYSDPLCHHKRGEWKASLEDCQALVGVADTVHYWQGVFPSAQLDWEGEFGKYQGDAAIAHYQYCFVYVDTDTYQSVKDAIEFFWPRLVTGGKMVFDDWQWSACAGVEKAIKEVFSEDQLTVFPAQYTCVVEKR